MKKKRFVIGKFNKKSVERNPRLIMLCIMLILGVFLGALSVKNTDSVYMPKIREIAENYIYSDQTNSVAEVFFSYISADSVFVLISAVFGLSLFGDPFLWIIPTFRGLGLGVIIGYLYKTYSLEGMLYAVLTVAIPNVISSLLMIVSCKESLLSSKEIRNSLKENRQLDFYGFLKLFIVRNLILFAGIIICGIFGCGLRYYFSGKISLAS